MISRRWWKILRTVKCVSRYARARVCVGTDSWSTVWMPSFPEELIFQISERYYYTRVVLLYIATFPPPPPPLRSSARAKGEGSKYIHISAPLPPPLHPRMYISRVRKINVAIFLRIFSSSCPRTATRPSRRLYYIHIVHACIFLLLLPLPSLPPRRSSTRTYFFPPAPSPFFRKHISLSRETSWRSIRIAVPHRHRPAFHTCTMGCSIRSYGCTENSIYI